MAGEAQLAGSGWGGEFHLHDGTALYELVQVVSFTLPSDEVDEIDITHLKSAGRRREYAEGLIDGGEFEVVLNYRPLSDTDIKIRAWQAAGGPRAFKAVIPERGTKTAQITGNAVLRGYDQGEVNAEDKMESTLTLRVTGAVTVAAYTA